MTTKTISGDQGLTEQKLSGADVYDARSAIVRVENGVNGYGFTWAGEPNGATLLGGRVIGQGINRTGTWAGIYSKGNGAAARFQTVSGITIDGLYADHCWDFIKVGPDFTVRNCRADHWLDDGIENDGYHSGRVLKCFLNGGHTFYSSNSSSTAATKPWHVEWRDCVMSLGCAQDGGAPCEDRDKRLEFPWACPTGSGQPWKVRANDGLHTMTFAYNACMIDSCINQTQGNLRWFTDGDIKLTPESKGNRFYYLGDFKGLTSISFLGGMVPQEFGLQDHPAGTWSRVSNSRVEWEGEIRHWLDTVDEEPEPPLPPSEDCEAKIAAAVAPLQMKIAEQLETIHLLQTIVQELNGDLKAEKNETERLRGIIASALDVLASA